MLFFQGFGEKIRSAETGPQLFTYGGGTVSKKDQPNFRTGGTVSEKDQTDFPP